jgi:hypothetical protein
MIGRLLISNKGLPFSLLADILDGIMIIVLFISSILSKSLRLTDANLQIKT